MKKLLSLIPVIMLICSCKSKTALDFSEKIVQKERSLGNDIENTESKVSDFISAGKFDSMAVVSTKMEGLINEKLNEIKGMQTPDLKFADDFKRHAMEYFVYMKKIYSGYAKYAKAETDELRQKEYENIQDMVSQKDNVIKTMRDSQKKFAEANGFKIKD
jgi:hypothetical protein